VAIGGNTSKGNSAEDQKTKNAIMIQKAEKTIARAGKKCRMLAKALCLLTIVYGPACKSPADSAPKPNIVIFYVDDLGYGDVGAYGSEAVKTPFLDSLSKTGILFTDAHSTAATCTPSRYSLLTGEHAFRHNAEILPGDAPLLIPEEKPTLPAMLKRAGYTTGVVGKWHLGLGNGNVDWNASVKPGPLEIGFDYSFLLPATGDRVPTVYLENHNVVNSRPDDPIVVSYSKKLEGYPNGLDSPQLLRQKADTQHSNTIVNGISRIGYMSGGREALWRDEDFPRVFSEKAQAFISQNSEKPFFLFFSFHDIHVPRVPNEMFAGKSPMGVRGDAITQMDWTTRQVVDHLKKLNLLENTIIIFTSDNGPVLNDGYEDLSEKLVGTHKPAGPFRGGKYSAFEAGTRVPMIVSWPGKVSPRKSDALISQVDLYRSLAAISGVPLTEGEAIDSEDHSQALTGKSSTGRTWLLEESYTFSARQGNWKYIAPIQEDKKVPSFMANKGVESGLGRIHQLYNLETDPGERVNMADSMPEMVQKMQQYIGTVVNKKMTGPR
jgi:arylsulfatase A-like enzyme